MKELARVGVRWLKESALYAYGLSSVLYSHISHIRPRPHVRESWRGSVDLDAARSVAVFVHFDRFGAVSHFVQYYLQQIHHAGYAIVFVSNAPRLDPVAVERLTPVCGVILRRDNGGRDFGAYKDGIQAIPSVERLDSLLLANDSVYGPFHDLRSSIARMSLAEADVWGITDSWERRFHLQAFFLLFGKKALTSAAFTRFWRRVRYVQAKSWIISRYEIGLTRAMIAGGLRCRALFPYRTAATAFTGRSPQRSDPLGRNERQFLRNLREVIDAGIPLNPTHFLWETLVSMGCPFLKRELLRDNPTRIPGVRRWEDVVRSVSDYDTDLIVRDLEVSMRRRSV